MAVSLSTAAKASRSIVAVIAASLLNAASGLLQTFWIPRLLSVDDFGRWRTFLLYMGYAGLLHLGLVDGGLLLWSKDPAQRNPGLGILGRSLQFVGFQHLLLLGIVSLVLFWPAAHVAAPFAIAFVAYALLFNLVGVVQVYLQTHMRFSVVALGMSAPGVLLAVVVVALALSHATVDRLLIGFFSAWTLTLLLLLLLARQTIAAPAATGSVAPPSAARLGWMYICAGWPIVLANTGFGLMQSADRVTVNLTRPVHDFAIYSLSQSTIYVPITILAAVSRVAFSFFARAEQGSRSTIYRSSSRALTLLWMLLLPYYFGVEYVVRRFLPKYAPGLPAGLILLFSVLFLSLIQIVQMNTYSLEGRQRQFFAGSIAAVAMAFATAWLGSRVAGTLAAVAWSQVVTAALWWIANEWALRRRTGVGWTDGLRILGGFTLALLTLWLVEHLSLSLWLEALLYSACILPMCLILFRTEMQIALQAARRLAARARAAKTPATGTGATA